MKLDKEAGEFKPDNSIDFGAALYLQLIDQSSRGLMWAGEGGMELTITGEDMEVAVDIAVTALNNTSRLAGGAGKAIAQKAAEEVINQILPLGFDTDIGSGNFYFTAKTMKSADMGYTEGDLTLELRPKIDGVPAIGGTIKKGTTLFDFTGDADANGISRWSLTSTAVLSGLLVVRSMFSLLPRRIEYGPGPVSSIDVMPV